MNIKFYQHIACEFNMSVKNEIPRSLIYMYHSKKEIPMCSFIEGELLSSQCFLD